MGLSRQVYWSGLPCPPPGDLPNPGIKPTSFMSPALASGFFTASATWEDQTGYYELTLNFKRHRQSFPGHRGKKPVCCRTRDEEEFVWEERKSFTKHPVMPGSILHVLLFNKLLCHFFRVQKHFVRFPQCKHSQLYKTKSTVFVSPHHHPLLLKSAPTMILLYWVNKYVLTMHFLSDPTMTKVRFWCAN